MHKIGHIVLVPFPFTDLSGQKVRPALIIGVPQSGDDLTVCFISSALPNKLTKFDIMIDPKGKNFKKTGLKSKSVIKVVKIATLDKAVILGQIGILDTDNLKQVKRTLSNYFSI